MVGLKRSEKPQGADSVTGIWHTCNPPEWTFIFPSQEHFPLLYSLLPCNPQGFLMLFAGVGLTEHSLWRSPWKLLLKALIQRRSNTELDIYLNITAKRPRKIADYHCSLIHFCQQLHQAWFVLLRNAELCVIFTFLRVFTPKSPLNFWERGLLTLWSNGCHSCSQIAGMFQTAWEEDEVKLLQI